MIKGFRFTNQLSNAEVDARIHQEFLNKNDGIFYGMDLSYTNNSITITEGLCEIAGRPVAVIDTETVTPSINSLYCLLVMEIDLSKETTSDTFEQVKFKILESSTAYPTVTQQDINIYNGENNIYQLEFARFRTGSNGISEFKDTRKFLNFNGIYAQIKADCEAVMKQIKQELANVENGSAYLLKNDIKILYINLGVENQNIEYPAGFNKNNTIVLSCMEKNNNRWFTTKTDNTGNLYSVADFWLEDDKIYMQGEFNKEYKIVLMKLPEYIEGEDYTLGDVNQDGIITEEDGTLAQNFSVGSELLTEQQFRAADVNKDGKVNSADALMIKQYSAGIIDSFE